MSSESNTAFIKGVFATLAAIAALVAIYEFVTKPQSPPAPEPPEGTSSYSFGTETTAMVVAATPTTASAASAADDSTQLKSKAVIVVTVIVPTQAVVTVPGQVAKDVSVLTNLAATSNLNNNVDVTDTKQAPEFLYREGFSHYLHGQYEQAVSKFKVCVTTYPSYSDCYNALGMVYREMGDYQQALLNHNKAIEINPRYDYYFERGVTHHQKSKYESAIDDFTLCFEKNSSFSNCAIRLGMAYRDIGDFQQALTYLNRAIELDPNRADFYWERAITYERIGNSAQAEADKKKARDLGYNR